MEANLKRMFAFNRSITGTLALALPYVVRGSPVGAVMAVPLPVDNEALGKRENEGIHHSPRKPSEKMKA